MPLYLHRNLMGLFCQRILRPVSADEARRLVTSFTDTTMARSHFESSPGAYARSWAMPMQIGLLDAEMIHDARRRKIIAGAGFVAMNTDIERECRWRIIDALFAHDAIRLVAIFVLFKMPPDAMPGIYRSWRFKYARTIHQLLRVLARNIVFSTFHW